MILELRVESIGLYVCKKDDRVGKESGSVFRDEDASLTGRSSDNGDSSFLVPVTDSTCGDPVKRGCFSNRQGGVLIF